MTFVSDSLFAVTALIIIVLLVMLPYAFFTYRRYQALRPPAPELKPASLRPELSDWSGPLTATWIGHSTVLFEIDGVRVLTDPVFSTRVGVRLFGTVIGPRRYVAPALDVSDIGRVDVILLSHAHLDHLDRPSLKALASTGAAVITAGQIGHLIPRKFPQITSLDWNDSTQVRGLNVESFEVRHWGRRFPWNARYGYCGFIVERNGVRVVFAGDTAYMDYSVVRQKAKGPIHLVCMPIGAYSPPAFQSSHCTPEQAWQMFEDSGASFFLPMHWNTFVLSQEPLDEPIKRLVAAAGSQRERITLSEQGETWVMPDAESRRQSPNLHLTNPVTR